MSKIGFIGLGIMGGPMAQNLRKAGFDLTVYNRTRAKCEPLAAAGATVAPDVVQLAQTCDRIVLMLADDAAVKQTVIGEGGILSTAHPGTIVIDSSTVHPRTSQQMAAALSARGMHFLDAPVTGSRKQAEEAILSFLIGGEESVFRSCENLFKAMGKRFFYLGKTGTGAAAKLGNNLMGAIHMAALAEAMSLVARYGLNPADFFQVISQSGARSAVVDGKGPKMLAGDFKADFALALMRKDVELAKDLAEQLDARAPLINAARDAYRKAEQAIGGQGDMCSIYQWYTQASTTSA